MAWGEGLGVLQRSDHTHVPMDSTHLTQIIKEKGEKGNTEVGRGCGGESREREKEGVD